MLYVRLLGLGLLIFKQGCVTSEVKFADQKTLFVYSGQEYNRDQLSIETQQKLHALQADYYQRATLLLGDEVINMYLRELAAEQKLDVAEVRKKYFPEIKLSDEEGRQFYEKYKSQIPYPYEIVKSEISSYARSILEDEQKGALLAEIGKRRAVYLNLHPPRPPAVAIDTSGFPRQGSEKAKVSIVEFGDFTCPSCKAAAAPLKKLLEKYRGQVNLTFKYFKLRDSVSKNLFSIAHCAHQQGRFWDFYDFVFENQMQVIWQRLDYFLKELKLDEEAMVACYNSPEIDSIVTASHDEAVKLGVKATPAFYVNGKLVGSGPASTESLEKAIQDELK